MKTKRIAIITFIVLSFIGIRVKDASAILMETTWMGTTTFADAGNAFNMEVGDPISGYACWDDTQITGAGPETIQFGDPLIDDGVLFLKIKCNGHLVI